MRSCVRCFGENDGRPKVCRKCRFAEQHAIWAEQARQSAHLGLCAISAAVTMVVILECALHGNAQCSRDVAVEMMQGQKFDAIDMVDRLLAGWRL